MRGRITIKITHDNGDVSNKEINFRNVEELKEFHHISVYNSGLPEAL
jgi:hypothetical protein